MTVWKNFKREEFACKHCGENLIQDKFVDRLQLLRDYCAFPFVITSGYRCPEHNQKVSSTGLNGPHTTGEAVDIAVSRQNAYRLVGLAIRLGFTGIGVNQKGNNRFIHLDTLQEPQHAPRPTIWSY